MFLSHLFRAGCAAALMLLLPGCGSDDKPEAPLPKIESLTFEQTSYEVGSGAFAVGGDAAVDGTSCDGGV